MIGSGDSQQIFISYRRGIDNDSAGRLFDRLVAAFPDKRVFRDVDSAGEMLGLDFHDVLTDRVQSCAVLVAVIGKGWIDNMGRLSSDADFVRIELAAALGRPGLRLIPVLVGDVNMPTAEDLPPALQSLVRRGAIRLSNEGYTKAVETVIGAIADVIGARGGQTAVPSTAAIKERKVRPATRPKRDLSLRMERGTARALQWAAVAALLVPALIWGAASVLLSSQARTVETQLETLVPSDVPQLARPVPDL